ncbi:MAG: glycosyltransferase family 1 protein [Bryobacterales bacterium]
MIYALDASYSLGRDPSGVAVYCSRIIQALAEAAPDDRFVLCYRANRFFRALLSPLPASNCSRRLMEEFAPFLPPRQAALFHGLNQRLPRTLFPRGGCRAITTFHDLFVMSGDYSTPEFRARFSGLARDAAGRSDHIIAVSQFTAGQIAEYLNYPCDRINVVHHGVDPVPEFSPQSRDAFRRKLELEAPFLLHVGAIQQRKNVARLVQAFEGLPERYLLVLAGAAGHGAREILDRIERSPARRRIRVLGYRNRDELNHLYRTATALAFASLEEGFGIPVLEAMSAGLPVVTSNSSALKDVAGDAALLVDPLDVDALRGALQAALEDKGARERLIAAGFRRAAEFTWQRAARETLAVYRS